jgi:hypothetical protein
MKSIGLILVWALLFYSCKEVTYKVPQPASATSLKEVPVSLRGKYQPTDISDDEKKDTLIIESWGYHFKDSDDKDWLGKGVISDSLVIKLYEDYYFINFRSDDQWALRLIKQKPNGDIEFMSIDLGDDTKRAEIIKKLSKKTKVKEIKRGEDIFYQINPTQAQLMTLIKEGFFTSNTLKKVK